MVPLRSIRDTLDSLRLVQRRLEVDRDPAWDTPAFFELQRILMKRITDLEAGDERDRRLDRTAA
jgi:hypothetical protein